MCAIDYRGPRESSPEPGTKAQLQWGVVPPGGAQPKIWVARLLCVFKTSSAIPDLDLQASFLSHGQNSL